MLQPYYANLTSQVVKVPKLFWGDMGLLLQASGGWGKQLHMRVHG
jgi:hypothetical protein